MAQAFDNLGFPIHVDGASTVVGGLHFVGVPFRRARKSPIVVGVGDDAGVVAGAIAERAARAQGEPWGPIAVRAPVPA